MRNWKRHLLTIIALLSLTLVFGPMGFAEWLWSSPRHILHNTMSAQSMADETQSNKLVIDLNEQVLHLQKEVADLRDRLQMTKQAKSLENSHIMEVIAWDARVLSRTRGQRQQMVDVHYVEVDKGGLDAVKTGMAMCSGKSLLGLVSAVKRDQAIVRLITDPQSRIAALIYQGKKRIAGGVLAGGPKSGLCHMLYIEDRPGLKIEPGFFVVSAGTGGLVPEGLILGEVIKASPGVSSDNWDIEVQPIRPVHAITEVLICRRKEQGVQPAKLRA
ncbi:MAG: rod shape-determining protein MreC [Planctomycetes bacterium]|nr:rod shape-determining protein MreC [Planctomycetota bacterium]